MVLFPSVLTAFVVIYYRAVLKMFGYRIEVTPIAPGKPEKLMKIWGIISLLIFLLLMIMFYFITKR